MYQKLSRPVDQLNTLIDDLLAQRYGEFSASNSIQTDVETLRSFLEQHRTLFKNLWSLIDAKQTRDLVTTLDSDLAPLNSMIALSWVLLEGMSGPLPPEQRTAILRLHRISNDLLEQFQNIWTHARILEETETYLKWMKFDFRERIINRAEIHGAVWYNLPDDLPQINSDEIYLMEAYYHLVDNAIKFSQNTGVSVSAQVQDNQMILEIQDSGSGIKLEDLDKIYDPFWQADSNSEGLGLGLFIAKSRLELLETPLTVETSIGVGSTFRFILPI